MKKPPLARKFDNSTHCGTSSMREIRSEPDNYNQCLFIQEGELTLWSHYSINADDSPFDQSSSPISLTNR